MYFQRKLYVKTGSLLCAQINLKIFAEFSFGNVVNEAEKIMSMTSQFLSALSPDLYQL